MPSLHFRADGLTVEVKPHSQILLLQVWCDHIKSKCDQGEVTVVGLSVVQPLERIGISNFT